VFTAPAVRAATSRTLARGGSDPAFQAIDPPMSAAFTDLYEQEHAAAFRPSAWAPGHRPGFHKNRKASCRIGFGPDPPRNVYRYCPISFPARAPALGGSTFLRVADDPPEAWRRHFERLRVLPQRRDSLCSPL